MGRNEAMDDTALTPTRSSRFGHSRALFFLTALLSPPLGSLTSLWISSLVNLQNLLFSAL